MKSKLNKPGHYLAAEFIKHASLLRKKLSKRSTIKLRWTPGHIDIEGNEQADTEAKKATEGLSSNEDALPRSLKSIIKQQISAQPSLRGEEEKEWEKEWSNHHIMTELGISTLPPVEKIPRTN